MLGQEKIVEYICSKDRETFPRSIILCGESGCGKHTITELIGKQLNLNIIDITDNISFDYLLELQQKPEPCVYRIEANRLTIKTQNALLKFVEEPLKNSFIVILSEYKDQLLQTIYNRCQVLNFSPYTKETLKQFTKDDFILKIAHTPGQIKSLEKCNIQELMSLCASVVSKMPTTTAGALLTISRKIAFKDGDKGFDLNVFSNTLNYVLVDFIKTHANIPTAYTDFYLLYAEWNKNRKSASVNQKYLFEHYLLEIKKCFEVAK